MGRLRRRSTINWTIEKQCQRSTIRRLKSRPLPRFPSLYFYYIFVLLHLPLPLVVICHYQLCGGVSYPFPLSLLFHVSFLIILLLPLLRKAGNVRVPYGGREYREIMSHTPPTQRTNKEEEGLRRPLFFSSVLCLFLSLFIFPFWL